MLELATLRKQAGLISSPSDELLQAEKKLAEVRLKIVLQVLIMLYANAKLKFN